MMRQMFSFRLLLRGTRVDDEAIARLMAAGCDDAVFGVESGLQIVDFDREALAFESAVLDAIRDVELADVGLFVTRVEPDELVTAAGIADRTGRTRQSISQLIKGDRRKGGFPTPYTTTDGKARIWHWVDVAEWLSDADLVGAPEQPHIAHFTAALNGLLDARRHLAKYSERGGEPGFVERLRELLIPQVPAPAKSIPAPKRAEGSDSRTSSGFPVSIARQRSYVADLACSFMDLWNEGKHRDTEKTSAFSHLVAAAVAHDHALSLRWQGDASAAVAWDLRVVSHSAELIRAFEETTTFAKPSKMLNASLGKKRVDHLLFDLVGCVEYVGQDDLRYGYNRSNHHVLNVARAVERQLGALSYGEVHCGVHDGVWHVQSALDSQVCLRLMDRRHDGLVVDVDDSPLESIEGLAIDAWGPLYIGSWAFVHALRRIAIKDLPQALALVDNAAERLDREMSHLRE